MKFQPNVFPEKSIALTYGDVFLSSYLNSSSRMNYTPGPMMLTQEESKIFVFWFC